MNWLTTVAKSDLSSVTLDSDANELSATFDLAVGKRGEVAEYTEVISMADAPEHLRVAASRFTDALMLAIREQAESNEEVRCTTCSGACCFAFDEVRVTQFDVDRMVEAGLAVEKHVVFDPALQPGAADWNGFVGAMKEVPITAHISKSALELGLTGCVNLTPQGCSIYEHRPTVCREFSSYTCGDTYEEDQKKVSARKNGKTTLRVVQ